MAVPQVGQNGTEKGDVGVPNTAQIQQAALYTQEHSETQLHTVRVSETAKALGFTLFLFDVVCMERTAFFIAFQGFDGVRSTQPTMP